MSDSPKVRVTEDGTIVCAIPFHPRKSSDLEDREEFRRALEELPQDHGRGPLVVCLGPVPPEGDEIRTVRIVGATPFFWVSDAGVRWLRGEAVGTVGRDSLAPEIDRKLNHHFSGGEEQP